MEDRHLFSLNCSIRSIYIISYFPEYGNYFAITPPLVVVTISVYTPSSLLPWTRGFPPLDSPFKTPNPRNESSERISYKTIPCNISCTHFSQIMLHNFPINFTTQFLTQYMSHKFPPPCHISFP